MSQWQSYSVCDVGCRRSVNQDAIYCHDQNQLWFVADGMGGHKEGDRASRELVAAFEDVQLSSTMAERIVQIEKTVRDVNQLLQDYADEQLNGQRIGSTIVLLTVCQGVGALIWAGDSRAYQLNSQSIKQTSWDHSHVAELIKAGAMTEEEAANSKLGNVITRAVGAHDNLYFDHVLFPISSEQTYLLCSDGLTGELNDEEIKTLVNRHGCSQESADSLLSATYQRGARDNVSIILIQQTGPSSSAIASEDTFNTYNSNINEISNSFHADAITLAEYYQSLNNVVNAALACHSSALNETTQRLPKVPSITDSNTRKFRALEESKNKGAALKYTSLTLLMILLAVLYINF